MSLSLSRLWAGFAPQDFRMKHRLPVVGWLNGRLRKDGRAPVDGSKTGRLLADGLRRGRLLAGGHSVPSESAPLIKRTRQGEATV